MGVDPISVAGLVLTVLQIAGGLIEQFNKINHVPEKLRSFEATLQDFFEDASAFEKILKWHGRPLTGTQSLERILRESAALLQKYSEMFQDRNRIQRGYDAVRLHYADESRLDYLSQEIDSKYLRLIYRSQLMIQ
jgi:hypothetical protein